MRRYSVAAVNTKIASLAGSKRAITVLSLPKYPAPDVLPDFQPLYQNTRPLNAVPTSVGPDGQCSPRHQTL